MCKILRFLSCLAFIVLGTMNAYTCRFGGKTSIKLNSLCQALSLRLEVGMVIKGEMKYVLLLMTLA